MEQLLQKEIEKLIDIGMKEDQIMQDVTTLACIREDMETVADVTLQQKAKIAGLVLIPWVIEKIDPSIRVILFAQEGQEYEEGAVLFRLEGRARSILSLERLLLNLLQHSIAIATKTAQYVEAVKGYSCDILDTRKTLPGLRMLQKYAVKIGGGKNHRFSLSDQFLIKDNHLALLGSTQASNISEGVFRARMFAPNIPLEVEVENLEMLKEALEAKVERILLDNMEVSTVREAVLIAQKRAYLEASGGITLETVRSYASTGVNGISIGALTHSVTAVHLSMSLQMPVCQA